MDLTDRKLRMSFVRQWLAALGTFIFHRQQLISTSGKLMQLLKVTRHFYPWALSTSKA
jgi:hypothetical protein